MKYLCCLIFLSFSFCSAQTTFNKKLIEFGWDYPTVSYLQKNIYTMQNTPFDGVVFSFDSQIYNAFDVINYPDSFFQFYKLTKIPWGRFTDNFLFVRGTGSEGAHWLDDGNWNMITENLKNLSKAVFLSGAKGIIFDPEYYQPNPHKNPWLYNDSLYHGLSYEQVGMFVKKRGTQFIQAMQTYSPNIKIMCLWLLGLVAAQNKSMPMPKTGMALYPFFIEGMLAGKSKRSEIIDGNETAYWYTTAANFIQAGEVLRNDGKKLISSTLDSSLEKVSLAQPVYLDGLFAKFPQFEKGYDTLTKMRWLKENLYNAFKTSDNYVWFYTEKVNWWKNMVDTGVVTAIKEIKLQLKKEYECVSPEKIGVTNTYYFKTGRYRNGAGYAYEQKMKILIISFHVAGLKNISVHSNSRLIFTAQTSESELKINLNGLYDGIGNLILSIDDGAGLTSSYLN